MSARDCNDYQRMKGDNLFVDLFVKDKNRNPLDVDLLTGININVYQKGTIIESYELGNPEITRDGNTVTFQITHELSLTLTKGPVEITVQLIAPEAAFIGGSHYRTGRFKVMEIIE